MDVVMTLLIAVGSGAVAGLVSWGGLRTDVRHLCRQVSALDARVDTLMLVLAKHGIISQEAISALARAKER